MNTEFGIKWPLPVTVMSEKDASWPSLHDIIAAKGEAS